MNDVTEVHKRKGSISARRELLAANVARIMASLGAPPAPEPKPALVVMCGLPGSGKSHFSRLLQERWPLVRLESDAVRKMLFVRPAYTPRENARLFAAINATLDEFLRADYSALLDATNVRERDRRKLYAIAERANARLVLISVEAPEALVRQRLSQRALGLDTLDVSDAGIEVYERMAERVQPIQRPHLVVDSSQNLEPFVELVLRELSLIEAAG